MYYINLICSRITNRMNNIFHAVIFRVCVCCVYVCARFDIYIVLRQISYTHVCYITQKLCDEENTPRATQRMN